MLDYFSDEFNEWDDEYYKKFEREVEEKLDNTPRIDDREEIVDGVRTHYIDQDYLNLQDEIQDLRQKEAQNALNRYRKSFAEKQKIAGAELIRILENQFKEIVVCYSYLDNKHKQGYITDLGIDEVSYYSHPKDKHNPKRLHDEVIGYGADDYDEMYLFSEEKENDNYETVIRNINM